MADLKEYQAFTPVTQPNDMGSTEFLVWLRELVDEVNALRARVADLEP